MEGSLSTLLQEIYRLNVTKELFSFDKGFILVVFSIASWFTLLFIDTHIGKEYSGINCNETERRR